MMREPVAIVLNEREAAKLKAVETLVDSLKSHNITSSRIPITADIVEIVVTRRPKVLVLDYLLGDYSTGLDIQNELLKLPPSERPAVFFLTDEPSVQVAVRALRVGALNYYELDRVDSVGLLTEEINSILKKDKTEAPKSDFKRLALDDLVFEETSSIKLRQSIRSAVVSHSKVIVLHGPSGSGLSALAQAIQAEASPELPTTQIDLRFYTGSMQEMTGLPVNSSTYPVIGTHRSLIVEHVEEDNGDLLEHIASILPYLGSRDSSGNTNLLVACTSCKQTAQAWEKLAQAKVFEVQKIDLRKDDIPPLVQKFLQEAEEMCGKKVKGIDASLLTWLRDQSWPGNIKQLRACVIDAAITHILEHTNLRTTIEEYIDLCKQETSNEEIETALNPQYAGYMIESSNFNFRIAAAKIGCSINKLRKTLDLR